ncbi:hypothetical protein ACEWY4_022043 [Coilia grayii]|uniref:Protein ripply2 n=1 Tax=Coilia grayii TaxID=363190 RepID=A0ABD1J6P7_9TELE
MDNFTAETSVSNATILSEYSTECAVQAPTCLWRPWINEQRRQTLDSQKPPARPTVTSSGCKANKRVAHPVKLFWPRSRCFDYLYQDAEALLRNYPVQATICLYADSSSDEDDSDMEDEKPE